MIGAPLEKRYPYPLPSWEFHSTTDYPIDYHDATPPPLCFKWNVAKAGDGVLDRRCDDGEEPEWDMHYGYFRCL